MALPATDSFTGTDANPIGGNWTTVTGRLALQRVSNQVAGQDDNDSVAYWNADTFADNQYSQVVFKSSSFILVSGVIVRASSSANTFYLFYQQTSTTMRIYRIVNGSATQLGSDYAINYAQNNVVRLEVSGTVLTPYVNGTPYTTQTDDQIASGSAGLWIKGAINYSDDWEGGNVAAGGGTSITPPAGSLSASGILPRNDLGIYVPTEVDA
jgi:hypothetical protein